MNYGKQQTMTSELFVENANDIVDNDWVVRASALTHPHPKKNSLEDGGRNVMGGISDTIRSNHINTMYKNH